MTGKLYNKYIKAPAVVYARTAKVILKSMKERGADEGRRGEADGKGD